MKEGIYFGRTAHCRHEPKIHSFVYPLCFTIINTKAIRSLDRYWPFLGYSRAALLRVKESDYLRNQTGTVFERAVSLLETEGITDVDRIYLLTVPRLLGYIFNPVNFYFAYNESEELCAVVSEVNNTFEESCAYVLPVREEERDNTRVHLMFPKKFYVSPFFKVQGDYEMIIHQHSEKVEVHVNIHDEGRRIFSSLVEGKAKPFSRWEVFKTALRVNFGFWLAVPRIHWQALNLLILRKLRPVVKPSVSGNAYEFSNSKSIWVHVRLGLVSLFAESTISDGHNKKDVLIDKELV